MFDEEYEEEYELPKNTSDRFFVKNKKHLEKVVKHCVQEFGNRCDLNFLNVSSVKDMKGLFAGYTSVRYDKNTGSWGDCIIDNPFVGDISRWDVSNVLSMRGMFKHSLFNGDISRWNVSKVCDMSDMFYHSQFNGDISQWNVSRVCDMNEMFKHSDFNGNLCNWNLRKFVEMEDMFLGCPCTRKPKEKEIVLDLDDFCK